MSSLYAWTIMFCSHPPVSPLPFPVPPAFPLPWCSFCTPGYPQTPILSQLTKCWAFRWAALCLAETGMFLDRDVSESGNCPTQMGFGGNSVIRGQHKSRHWIDFSLSKASSLRQECLNSIVLICQMRRLGCMIA